MKRARTMLFIAGVCFTMLFPGCKKCITCTESHSGVTAEEYCGTPAQVKNYEKELKEQGSALGQDWTCVSK
jgi:hypothetical protein